MNERCLSEEVLTMVHAFPDKGRKDGEYLHDYDAAKAELERVKSPPQPQPSERVDDAGEG